MTEVGVRLEGMARLRSTLRRAGVDLVELKPINRAAADTVASAARAGAPVGETGRLSASVRAGATKTAGMIRAGRNSTVRYANPIHWGWGRRNIAANPWMSRAARATEPTWLPIYERHLAETLDQIKGA